jgi:hypothetical protein
VGKVKYQVQLAMNRIVCRTLRRLLTVAAFVVLYTSLGLPVNAQIKLDVFADPHSVVSGGTIGFAYAGNKFVGSVDTNGAGVLYATDLDGTNVRLFAPTVSVPGGNIANEHFVASSAGLGGFPSRDIYVGAGTGILHITNDGGSSDMFVSSLASPVRGILFDLVGTFGHNMLVSTHGGQVYRINSSGVVKLLASVGEDTEGMDIAPLGANFGSFDGQLVAVSETSGLLRAISPSGAISVLNGANPIPDSEMVTFVPLDLGASGSPVEGLYEANWTINVLKADRGQFTSFKGDAVVTSEIGDRRISRVHWNGTSFDISVVGNFPNQGEDGIFVTPTMINPGVGCPATEATRGDPRDVHNTGRRTGHRRDQ